MNIILFIPIGFLLYPILPERKKNIYATLFGILFSSFIEFNQIFIPGRSPGFNDIVTNGAGALIGVMGHHYVKEYVRERSEKLWHLGIPLMDIIFLMIPLLWLSSFAAGHDINRLWLLLLLGIIGAVLVSEIYINRIPDKSFVYLILFIFLLSTWYSISIFPALYKYPKRTIFFIMLINIFAFIRFKYGYKPINDKRFELRTLNKIIPLFVIYVLLLNQWPLSIPRSSFQFSWLTDYKLQQIYFISIYRYVEYFAAFAMIGYLLSEYINRSNNKINKSRRVISWLLITAIILEIPRGFHPGYFATIENIIVSFAWSIFGAGIYVMQLEYSKFLRNET